MKTFIQRSLVALAICLFGLCPFGDLNAQGRLIINEFLNWPNNTCGATTEFIELKNIGPGSMNIGCYVITEGDFSITIPPNTMLAPGKYFILGGQNTIAAPCANLTLPVNVNLNWNNCGGCTSGTIPTTGDGLMTDGGSASEQIVLFNPSGQVIDAVVRDTTTKESSSAITTAAMGGGCSSFSFDLDNLNIKYEMIGESPGRGNSYARRMDADCKWVKETQQSGGTTNDVTGELSALAVTETITLNMGCTTGNAVFTINNADVNLYFPFNYVLAYDANGDGMFNSSDVFISGTDNTSPSIEFNNMALGTYSVMMEPAIGCNQINRVFSIGPCTLMGIKLKRFTGKRSSGKNNFDIQIETDTDTKEIKLEYSNDGKNFIADGSVPFEKTVGIQNITYNSHTLANGFFRLWLADAKGNSGYSQIIHLNGSTQESLMAQIAPNPFTDMLGINLQAERDDQAEVQVMTQMGAMVMSDRYHIKAGINQIRVVANKLPKGIYIVSVRKLATGERQMLRAFKQ